jgi:hypothetical protein
LPRLGSIGGGGVRGSGGRLSSAMRQLYVVAQYRLRG